MFGGKVFMFVLEEFLHSGAILQESSTSWLVFWGDYSWSKSPSASQPSLYAPDFFMKNENPWLNFNSFSKISSSELQKILEGRKDGEKISLKQLQQQWEEMNSLSWNWREPNKSEFEQEFNQFKELFQSSQLKKAVPISFLKSPVIPEGFVLKNLIHKLLLSESGHHGYGFWTEEEGLIGISPEILLEQNKSKISSVALAGTAEDPQDLINDPKQLKEHHLVSQGIKESFKHDEVHLGETQAWNAGSFWHLKTPIEIELKKAMSFDSLIHKFHPTPALGGYPKKSYWSWAIENSYGRNERMRFGAPFGVRQSDEQCKIIVAIRNVQWNNQDGLKLISGCGIVEESELESEWKESELKRESVRRMFGI